MTKKVFLKSEIKPSDQMGYYAVHAYCLNCKQRNVVYLPKGTPITSLTSLDSITCPNCGCTITEHSIQAIVP